MNPVHVVEPEDVLTKVVGRLITDWHMDTEGLYFALDDGACVAFIGDFMVSIVQDKGSVQ